MEVNPLVASGHAEGPQMSSENPGGKPEDTSVPDLDESASFIEVGFQVTDPTYPFVGVTLEEDCQVALERMVPRGDGEYAEFFTITGIDPDRVVGLVEANDFVLETRVLTSGDDEGLFEFTVNDRDESCPAADLAELGSIPRELTGSKGVGRVVVEMRAEADASELISSFLEMHPDAELVLKREKDHGTSLLGADELENTIEESLTGRQKEALVTAFEAGYYECPRMTSGSELAGELDISQPTFNELLRTAERKLLTSIYGQE